MDIREHDFQNDGGRWGSPALAARCGCALHSRRLFSAALATGAAASLLVPASVLAQDAALAKMCKRSAAGKLVPAAQVEQAAAQQYRQLQQQAAQKRALAPDSHPQLIRLREIAKRIVPFSSECNDAAAAWKWEVSLLGSPELNAFCMPGGKIAFYFGILQKLQLNDDEVAVIMGHEVAHALLEHARERMGKTTGVRIGAAAISAIFGLGGVGDALVNMGGQLLTLTFSREDESEADLVGLDLCARAGYDPRAGVSLWQKMATASKGSPPQWLSTHPAGATRIKDIEAQLPRVLPIYNAAAKPTQRFEPPAKAAPKEGDSNKP